MPHTLPSKMSSWQTPPCLEDASRTAPLYTCTVSGHENLAKVGLQVQVAVDDGEGSDSDTDTDEGLTQAELASTEMSLRMAGELQPGQEPHMNGGAEGMHLREEGLRDTTPKPEQACHDELADSSARSMQLEGDTSVADPAEQIEAGEQSAEHGRTAPQKPQKSLPVISVLAVCREEVSPRDPLAVIQIPQQHAEGVQGSIQAFSEPASGAEHSALEKPKFQMSANAAEQGAVPAPTNVQVTGDISPAQAALIEPDKQSGEPNTNRSLLSDVVQQPASCSLPGIIPDTGMLHASLAQQFVDTCPAPSTGCGTEDAASPKRERRPSSKAAEAPAPAPKSPGRSASLALHAPALRKRPARSKRAWKEGTYIGNGMWLMCYCSRHTRALEEMGASQAVVSMTTGQALQDALSPQPKARQNPGRPQSMPTAEPHQAPAVGGCPDGALQSVADCNAMTLSRQHRHLRAISW